MGKISALFKQLPDLRVVRNITPCVDKHEEVKHSLQSNLFLKREAFHRVKFSTELHDPSAIKWIMKSGHNVPEWSHMVGV